MISVSCTHSLSINISNVTCNLGWRRPQDVVYISQRHHKRCPYNLLSGREPWWSFKIHRTTVTYITLFFIIFTLLVECPLLLRGSRPRPVCFLNFLSYPPAKVSAWTGRVLDAHSRQTGYQRGKSRQSPVYNASRSTLGRAFLLNSFPHPAHLRGDKLLVQWPT